jgi:hypothetical protein
VLHTNPALLMLLLLTPLVLAVAMAAMMNQPSSTSLSAHDMD